MISLHAFLCNNVCKAWFLQRRRGKEMLVYNEPGAIPTRGFSLLKRGAWGAQGGGGNTFCHMLRSFALLLVALYCLCLALHLLCVGLALRCVASFCLALLLVALSCFARRSGERITCCSWDGRGRWWSGAGGKTCSCRYVPQSGGCLDQHAIVCECVC